MARPRENVRENGKPTKHLTGVSVNRSNGRFYVIPSNGQRSYFRTWIVARAAHVAAEQDRLSAEQRAAMDDHIWLRFAAP